MKADHLVVVVSSLRYLPLRVWKMILPAMMLMWPNRRLVWSHVAGSWPVGGQSEYELWSSFVQYLCKYRENTTETINYTNNYSAVKLEDCLSVFFTSRLIYPRTALHCPDCQTQPLSSTHCPDQNVFPSRPARDQLEHIWDLRWAIWSLSEDWCEVLVKFKLISVPWAAVIMKY